MRIFPFIILYFSVIAVNAQISFPYSIHLEEYTIPDFPGIHSYVVGKADGYWCLIGGRNDGIHARQPFRSFPAEEANTQIYVIDPRQRKVWSASIEDLAPELKDQFQSSNIQYYQDNEQLIIIGGYGFSEQYGEHMTYPYLTVVDVPELVKNVISGHALKGTLFQFIIDDFFAETGGNLGKIEQTFYLVGGHRFDGRYNPMGHASYIQTYSDAIRKFNLTEQDGKLKILEKSQWKDPIHLHRRDNHLIPQIFPGGEPGYTVFSGVFQINNDLPYLHPVNIFSDRFEVLPEFNQYLSHYHSAHLAMYNPEQKQMHSLFFGGISRYYYENGDFIEDDDVPFVNTISKISRNQDGMLEESMLPQVMPRLSGSNAEFIHDDLTPLISHDIVDLSRMQNDTNLLGYIVGGIESSQLNPFVYNEIETTKASSTIYQVFLVHNSMAADQEIVLEGGHGFSLSLDTEPLRNGHLRFTLSCHEAGSVEVFLSDKAGNIIVNEKLSGIMMGENVVELEKLSITKGNYRLTVMLNGKFTDIADFEKNN